jgi:hypothetical protein
MNFLTAFAISSLLAAVALHVCIAVRLEWIARKISRHGEDLVVRVGKGLPRINYADPRIPPSLEAKFRTCKRLWCVAMPILLSPMAVYLIVRHFTAQ